MWNGLNDNNMPDSPSKNGRAWLISITRMRDPCIVWCVAFTQDMLSQERT